MNKWGMLLMTNLLLKATFDTLYMVLASGAIAVLIGLPLGILTLITRKNGIKQQWLLHKILSSMINIGRSIPFIILMIALIPFTRLLIGTSIGTTAAIVPLAIAAIPFMARIAENALQEVNSGLIETGHAFAATPLQIIRYILLPEAKPALMAGITLMLINLIGYSAMAGAVGGGGLGAVAINYGYQRFNVNIMLATILILVIMVQLMQWIGDWLVRRLSHN